MICENFSFRVDQSAHRAGKLRIEAEIFQSGSKLWKHQADLEFRACAVIGVIQRSLITCNRGVFVEFNKQRTGIEFSALPLKSDTFADTSEEIRDPKLYYLLVHDCPRSSKVQEFADRRRIRTVVWPLRSRYHEHVSCQLSALATT